MSGRILVYTTQGCPHSTHVMQILKEEGLGFDVVDVAEYPLGIDTVFSVTGCRALPQVFVNEHLVGDLQAVKLLQGGLSKKVSELMATPKNSLSSHSLISDQEEDGVDEYKQEMFIIPKPKEAEASKHVKLNVVLDDIWTRAHLSEKEGGVKRAKKMAFKGSELIAWLCTKNGASKEVALKMGANMKTSQYFVAFKEKDSEKDKPFGDDSTLWIFLSDKEPEILNNRLVQAPRLTGKTGESLERYPPEIALSLVTQMFSMISNHTNSKGQVSYDALLQDPAWETFMIDILELNLITVFYDISPKERTVFLLQLHELLYNHLCVLFGGYPTSPAEIKQFNNSHGYLIQGHKFTLHTIASILVTGKMPEGKKKKKAVPTTTLIDTDVRILFGTLKPLTKSPPILLFNDKNVDFALHWATETFCSDVVVSRSQKTVTCPHFFANILPLFNSDAEFFSWLVQFLPEKQERKFYALAHTELKIKFRKMPWEEGALSLFHILETNQEPLKGSLDAPETEESELEEEPEKYNHPRRPTSIANIQVSSLQIPEDTFDCSVALSIPPRKRSQIRRLVLTHNSIIKAPETFASLFPALSMLDLSYNSLESIPYAIADLHTLETLNLSYNKLTSIPNRFFCLRNLKHCYLDHNKFTEIPSGIAQLRSVEELNLSHNNLVKIPQNFGEMGFLDCLDLSHNKLTELPDLSNLVLLQDFHVHHNLLKSFDFGLKGLRHLVTFDVSFNAITEIPMTITHLQYLQELKLSSNKISIVPKELCDLLTLPDHGLKLGGNPITNIPEEIIANGSYEAIRTFYGWEKPQIREIGPPKNAPTMSKALSVREKRALLMKKRTKKEFDPSKIQDLKERYGADDIMAFFRGMDIPDGETTRHTDIGTPIKKGAKDDFIATDLDAYIVEERGPIDSLPLTLQDFLFKPDYHRSFFQTTHTNFLGISKEFGPIVISIKDLDDEPLKERKPVTRTKSLVLRGGRRVSRKSTQPLITLSLDKADPTSESDTGKKLKKSLRGKPLSGNESTRVKTPKSASYDLKNLFNPDLRVISELEGSTSKRESGSSESVAVPKQSGSITEREGETHEEEGHDHIDYIRVLARTPKRDNVYRIFLGDAAKKSPKDLLKSFKETHPEFSGISYKMNRTSELEAELVALEMRLMVKGYKFGILYCDKGQRKENDFFQNQKVGKNYAEFLEWLGTTIALKGWEKYNAGLDVERDSTGTHSLYSNFNDLDIMFHVSTMLPYTPDDPQQLQRKRHLGNDVVVVLFQEGDCPVFDPRVIHSFFNHVFVVIKKDKKESRNRGETTYRIGVVSKVGVQNFLPTLPHDGYIMKNEEGRNWLLTKLINAERASYQAPGFAKAIERTREQLMSQIMAQFHSGGGGSAGWG
eukprot:TRINITY_DN882_c0_g1_i1.p1 TRINITY_DN882_c0_g1~~TRINITY_DN882_c0_g1_i1.p1  ORF type:complete len:1382 (-),score=285.85 TRINITY_DN882_c0_g1_i1:107-4252(-)